MLKIDVLKISVADKAMQLYKALIVELIDNSHVVRFVLSYDKNLLMQMFDENIHKILCFCDE